MTPQPPIAIYQAIFLVRSQQCDCRTSCKRWASSNRRCFDLGHERDTLVGHLGLESGIRYTRKSFKNERFDRDTCDLEVLSQVKKHIQQMHKIQPQVPLYRVHGVCNALHQVIQLLLVFECFALGCLMESCWTTNAANGTVIRHPSSYHGVVSGCFLLIPEWQCLTVGVDLALRMTAIPSQY